MRSSNKTSLISALIFSASVCVGADLNPGLATEPLVDLDLTFLSENLQVPWGNDPFLKVAGFAQVKKSEASFALGGIVYSKTEPMAIVNGESVLIGDEIDGRTVVSIGKNYVILKKGDSLKELVLPPVEDE